MASRDVERLFKKRRFGKAQQELKHMELESPEGTATRAVYMGAREMPMIELAFKVPYSRDPRTGESFDAIEITMDLWAANEFAQQLLNSLSAANPHQPRSMQRNQYGE